MEMIDLETEFTRAIRTLTLHRISSIHLRTQKGLLIRSSDLAKDHLKNCGWPTYFPSELCRMKNLRVLTTQSSKKLIKSGQ